MPFIRVVMLSGFVMASTSEFTRRCDQPAVHFNWVEVTGHADQVTLENYDDEDYGYLRIIASATQLRIEYHPASDGTGAKTPDDIVTVDLASRTFVAGSVPA
jgi:hypothetical protein